MVTRQGICFSVSAEIEKKFQSGSPCPLKERQGTARKHQSGSRNPRPPDASSLFGDGILHRLLPRVSGAKPLLLFCDSDGFAERSLNLAFLSTSSGEKHTPEPGAFLRTTSPIRIFRPALAPPFRASRASEVQPPRCSASAFRRWTRCAKRHSCDMRHR